MTSQADKDQRKLPNPIYAAAGAGELAIERLRDLPGRLGDLRERVKLDERLATVREDLREAGRKVRDIDTAGLREKAVTAAAKAQERAKETYAELVTRGERVASGERSPIRVIATIARPDAGKKDAGAAAGTAAGTAGAADAGAGAAGAAGAGAKPAPRAKRAAGTKAKKD